MSLEDHAAIPASRREARPGFLDCKVCGNAHRPVLAGGETARCARCGAVLARKGRFGPDAPLAFSLTGLMLAPPAMLLPFITVGKLGNERTGTLLTGAQALWNDGLHLVSAWIFVCSSFAPVFLLLVMVALLGLPRLGWRLVPRPRLLWAAQAVAQWSIPEVQVLAVLVALARMGQVVHVSLGSGFWCYVALAVTTTLAWRGFRTGAWLEIHLFRRPLA